MVSNYGVGIEVEYIDQEFAAACPVLERPTDQRGRKEQRTYFHYRRAIAKTQ